MRHCASACWLGQGSPRCPCEGQHPRRLHGCPCRACTPTDQPWSHHGSRPFVPPGCRRGGAVLSPSRLACWRGVPLAPCPWCVFVSPAVGLAFINDQPAAIQWWGLFALGELRPGAAIPTPAAAVGQWAAVTHLSLSGGGWHLDSEVRRQAGGCTLPGSPAGVSCAPAHAGARQLVCVASTLPTLPRPPVMAGYSWRWGRLRPGQPILSLAAGGSGRPLLPVAFRGRLAARTGVGFGGGMGGGRAVAGGGSWRERGAGSLCLVCVLEVGGCSGGSAPHPLAMWHAAGGGVLTAHSLQPAHSPQ